MATVQRKKKLNIYK